MDSNGGLSNAAALARATLSSLGDPNVHVRHDLADAALAAHAKARNLRVVDVPYNGACAYSAMEELHETH